MTRLIVMYVLLRTAERVLCGTCMYVYPRGRSNPQGHARGSDLHGGGYAIRDSTNPSLYLSLHLGFYLVTYYDNEAGLALASEAA